MGSESTVGGVTAGKRQWGGLRESTRVDKCRSGR